MNRRRTAVALLFAAALALGDAPLAAQSDAALAEQQSDASLLRWIATRPDAARDSMRQLLTATAGAAPAATAAYLAGAERLGAGYAEVWGDPFPLADVRRFARWPADRRALRLRADSLRRAGNAAIGGAGLSAALRDWRASYRIARWLTDTAGMAAALGNIGAGFHRFGEPDSAHTYFTAARDLANAAGDRRTLLNAMGGLASVALERADLASAREQYGATLALRRQAGDYRGVAADANNLGLIAEELGETAEARRRYTEALVTAREHELEEAAAAPLVNLAALASTEGDDATAERRYREALAFYRRLGDSGFEALVLHDLGSVEAGRGNYPAAAAHYRAALELLVPLDAAEDVVAARGDLAQVLAAMGQLDPADAELREAERIARENGLDAGIRGRLLLTRGSLAEQLNRLSPARTAYTGALSLFRASGDAAGEGAALAAVGGLSLRTGQHAAAREQLAAAAARQEVAGDRRAAGLTSLLAGRAARELGDTSAARRLIAAATDGLRGAGDRVGEAWGLCEAAELQRITGLPIAAERTYRRGIERLGRRPAPEVASCLYGGLAATLRSRGAAAEAISALKRGIEAVELAASYAVAPARRADFLSDKWELYGDLALAQRAAGDAAGAFETSERGRARHSLDRLAHGSAPSQPSAAAALRRRITALMSGAAPRTGTVLRGADALERLPNERREALARAHEAYAAIIDSLENARARTAPRAPAATTGWRAVAARLSADAALVEYLVTDSAAIAFVVTSDRVTAVDLPTTGAQLAAAMDFLRGVLTNSDRERGAGSAARALAKLGSQLVAPVERAGLLAGKQRLVVVPHRELHYLPFAALIDERSGRHLIERYELTSAASAAVWLRLDTAASRPARAGLLAIAPLGRELPGAEAEVSAIARIYGARATVLRGAQATRTAFAAAAPGYGIVHVATLGVLNRHNPLFSFVSLAPARDSDGRLEVHEISALRLSADLVVLSACQTGLGAGRLTDVPPGDDWVGLVGAFQTAGASRVLATLWPVDDRVTAQLMTRFYTELRAGRSEAASLAIAQRSVLASAATRSPFYWAGFVLHGSH